MIAAPWRSSGKTTVSIGLAACAHQRGIDIQCFKKGPDYIDPLWLKAASGRPCFNLDPVLQSSGEVKATFETYASDAAMTLVEGTMGLHDGLKQDGSDSSTALARLIDVPIVLVVDVRGMTRTVAAIVNGLVDFDRGARFAGIILNQVRTMRHESKLRQAIEANTDLMVCGAMPADSSLSIAEQELGLVPAPAHHDVQRKITTIATMVDANCDVDTLFSDVGASLPSEKARVSRTSPTDKPKSDKQGANLTVGVAKDAAFQFYYEDDLLRLKSHGVTLTELSPMADAFPQDLSGFIIGGGFPERFAAELAANTPFREGLRQAIAGGLPVHAECAGLMYLCRSMTINNMRHNMVRVIPATVTMKERPQGRGYVRLARYGMKDSIEIHGHEFHHSHIEFDEEPQFLYRVLRGHGIDGNNDGVVVKNVEASYTHFRHTEKTPWVDKFLSTMLSHRDTTHLDATSDATSDANHPTDVNYPNV